MVDQNFCAQLECTINEQFARATDYDLRGFWCDGVVIVGPGSYYTIRYVNAHRQILLKAFVGKGGQTEYDLILYIGKKSMSRYARNLDILPCLPQPGKVDRFLVDTFQRKMEIHLD